MNKYIGDHIRATLFDHDDTLLNTLGRKAALFKHIAKNHYQKEVSDEEIRAHWGKTLTQLSCALYETDDIEQVLKYERQYRDHFPKELFSATFSTLQKIHSTGRLVGVVTATTRQSFEHDVTTHKFPLEIIDYTQTEEDTPHHKPDPRVFEPALKWLDIHRIKPSEVLYVGDSLRDMQAARGAGFEFVGVQTGFISAEEFDSHGAISISGIGELA